MTQSRRAILVALAFGLFAIDIGSPPPACASDPVLAGFRDFAFPSGTGGDSAATGEKPESKLWWNDGSWWGVLWNDVRAAYHIYRLDVATQDWIDTGTAVDDRPSTKADTLWDGTRLYVASHEFSASGDPSPPGQHGELYRFDYDAPTETYSLDFGFPVEINDAESETLVIAKDSTGTLWSVWVENQRVMINHSRNGDDADWDVPFGLPAVDTANLTSDDIASIVAYDGHVGVLWSNQTTAQMYFAAHVDGDPELTWNSVIAFGISADDHINLKSVHAEPNGRVFAVIKTSLGSPLIVLVVCENTLNHCKSVSDWDFHVVYATNTGTPTRPILLVDTENRDLYVFSRNRDGGEGAIYYKRTSMDDISFESGLGTAFIKSATETNINNATSTKQNLNSATGLAVLASDSTSLDYFHNYLALGSSGGVPVLVSFSPSSGSPGAEVTLFGLNFTGALDTSFDGLSASFTVDSDSQIRATVPPAASSGLISVAGSAGTGFSQTSFAVGGGPVIDSFDPTLGAVNTEVTVAGLDFAGATAVAFNGAPAAFVVDSDSQLRATVPVGATTGRISVTNSTGTGFSATDFTVAGGQVLVTFMETANGTASITDVVTTSTDLSAADGHLYLASIAMKPAVAVSSVTGLGLAWSPVVLQCAGRNQTRVEIWMAQGQASGDGPVSATLAAPPSNAVISVTRYSGVDTVSPIGIGGSANTNGEGGACGGGTDSASYAFTLGTTRNDSHVHAAAAMRNRAHAPGAGYLELDEIHAGSGGGGASAAIQTAAVPAPAQVTVNGTFDGSVDWAAAAVEILAGSTATCAVDADCDDGLFCNGAEACGAGGACAAGSAPSCEDGVACTADLCNESTDACDHSPSNLACDNGFFCDGAELCDTVAGCLAGLPPCDDLVDCTVDGCDEVTNRCLNVPDDLACDDGEACTADSCDSATGCTHIDTCTPAIVAFEDVQSGVSSDSATVATATDVVAAFDHLYLASIASRRRRDVVSVEGLGLAWSRVGAQCSARNATGVELWAALGTPAADGIVTATLSRSTNNAVIAVARYSGVDVATPIGSVGSANTNGPAGPCSGGTDSAAYALDLQTTSPNALALAAVAMRQRTHTPGAGYTERIEINQGSAGRTASTAVEDRTITSPQIVLVDGLFNVAVDWAVVAVEVVPASGPQCANDTECADGLHCNGTETCVGGSCTAGAPPCPGQHCREADDVCVDCLNDADCDDATFCNGAESCDAAGACVAGASPCTGRLCREVDDACVDCLSSADCDDVAFCNGAELCGGAGTCAAGTDPCPGLQCDELSDVCAACTVDADCANDTFCDGAESCQTGSCSAGTAPCPGQQCREIDHACVECLEDGDCDDGLVCSGAETCNGVGDCVAGTPLDCDDAVACTTDQCSEAAGGCRNLPFDTACDDGDACTIDTCGAQTGCAHENTCNPSAVLLEEIATGVSADTPNVATNTVLTAPAGAFYIAALSFKPNVTVESVTGLGVSWTRVLTQCSGRNQTGVEVWAADGPPTSAGAVSGSFASAPRNAAIAVARYAGADAVAPIGAVRAANTNGPGGGCSGGSDGSSYSFPLAATEAGAAVYVAPAMRNRDHAPGTGFTEHTEIHAGSGGSGASVAVADTSVAAPGTVSVHGSFSGGVDWAVIAVEIVP